MPEELFYFRDSDIPAALTDIPQAVFTPLAEGLKNSKVVEIAYQNSSAETTLRKVFPEVFFRTSDVWYLAAYCFTKEEPRTFRFDRIQSAVLTGETDETHGIAEDYREHGIPWKRAFTPEEKKTESAGLWMKLQIVQGENGPEFRCTNGAPHVERPPKMVRDFSFDLVHHAEAGQIDRMKEDLAAGADMHFFDGRGEIPLTAAVSSGNLEAVKFLLSQGAEVEQRGGGNDTALIRAVQHCRSLEIVRYLVEECRADVNAQGCCGFTPLIRAIFFNRIDLILYLIEHGADVNLCTKEQQSPLMLTMDGLFYQRKKLFDAARILIRRGADVNCQDNKGKTALHYAIAGGFTAGVQYLLKHGASVVLTDKKGNSPLLFAVKFCNCGSGYFSRQAQEGKKNDEILVMKIIRLLLQYGSNVNTADKAGVTPLMLAHGELFRLLLAAGAYIDASDRQGNTVAMYHGQYYDELRILEERGANLHARNFQGDDILLYTEVNCEIAKCLIEHFGFSVNDRNDYGTTPLHRACEEENLPLVKYLLRHGADPNVRNSDGKTPFMLLDLQDLDDGWNDRNIIRGYVIQALDQKTKMLHNACRKMNLEEIKSALEQGADITRPSNNGLLETAITIIAKQYIEQRGQIPYEQFHEMMKFLLKKGASATDVDADGNSLWSVAIWDDNEELLQECFDCLCTYSARANDCVLNNFLQQLDSAQKRYASRHNGAESVVLTAVMDKVRDEISFIKEIASLHP